MANSKLLMGAVAALALGLAGPAFAQNAANATTTGAAGNHSNTDVTNIDKTLVFAPSTSSTRNSTESSTRNSTESLSYSNSSQRNDNSQRNGNIRLVADQSLDASISNESTLNLNGKKSNYGSGSNSVNGSAFAAYSGILNQAWNTGINSNTQAATNIAAQGTTSFATH